MKSYEDYVKELVMGLTIGENARKTKAAVICNSYLNTEEKQIVRDQIEDILTDEERPVDRLGSLIPGIRRRIDTSMYEVFNTIHEKQGETSEFYNLIFDLFLKSKINTKYFPDFHHSLMKIKDVFGLDDISTRIVAYYFVLEQETRLEDPIPERERKDYFLDNYEFISSNRKDVLTALSSKGPLVKSGIMNFSRPYLNGLTPQITEFLMGSGDENFHDKYVSTEPEEVLPLEYYCHDKTQMNILQRLLRSSKNLNVLFSGTPGTGKTSLAFSLAKELGGAIYVKHDIEGTDDRRLGLYTARRLAQKSGKILIIDEADELIQKSPGMMFFSKRDDGKSWINLFLDGFANDEQVEPTRTIWISNITSKLDPSTARRFNYVMDFKPLNFNQRKSIWMNVINKYDQQWLIDDQGLDRLIRKYDIDLGSIDDAISRVADLGEKDMFFLTHYLDQKMSFLRGETAETDNTKKQYRIDALNMSTPPEKVITALKNFENRKSEVKNFNLLLEGPSGTGKTEFVKYLSEVLDRKVVTKSVSDLMSKWVGETEANIRRAFTDAQDHILFFDEADTFFASREGAQRQYEVNMVNEVLVRMEKFSGVFIASTNFLSHFDKAALRRFQMKVSFDYLNEQGKRTLFASYFPEHEIMPEMLNLKSVTPGDFKNVALRLSYLNSFEASDILREFTQEVSYKSPKREVGLGRN